MHLWRTERFPQLQRAAKKAGARIYFADEASVRTDFHSGTTWAPVGRTPIVRRTGNRSSVTMISAVAATGDMHFAILDGNATSERFIGFCRQLLTDIDRPIYLVVDGHSCHTSTATKTFVESTNGRLTLWYLPPYSPELNPDEWVWKNVKHDHIGKSAPCGRSDLYDLAVNALQHLKDTPALVRAFFGDPDLAYISA